MLIKSGRLISQRHSLATIRVFPLSLQTVMPGFSTTDKLPKPFKANKSKYAIERESKNKTTKEVRKADPEAPAYLED